MNPILSDFYDDLKRIERLLDFVECVSKFPNAFGDSCAKVNEDSSMSCKTVLQSCIEAKVALPILNGAIILYLSGRFEYFVREIFEDMCSELSKRCKYYEKLPKEMRDNLIKFTAKVIPESRKYGHGDGAVTTFVRNLADNLAGKEIADVNVQCLSVTDSNMKSTMLNDLFTRAGLHKLWETLGQQTSMKTFFNEQSPQLVSKKAQEQLDKLMMQRNMVAHPSGSFTWPPAEEVRNAVEFLRVLSSALSDHCGLYASTVSAS